MFYNFYAELLLNRRFGMPGSLRQESSWAFASSHLVPSLKTSLSLHGTRLGVEWFDGAYSGKIHGVMLTISD